MSNVVDERVVQMQFDNTQFESNVNTSMSTIEKLKKALNFDNAGKGLSSLNDSAKSVNFNPITSGIQSVKMEFSALQVAAATAVSRITNSIISMGTQMTSNLTGITAMRAGMSEYETQIGAVQTILANTSSKGTTLDQVNTALDELNHYADMTIYNFTQMTRNIGTFTAAGVDLQTSVDSIQGIANLAAVSGSTSQQASTAMYQLSQAIAAGTVKLMDWNSVVNAGMGGEVFQNALKRTSEHLGTGAEAAIEAQGSFRESLSEGWLTVDVLTETLKQFTLASETTEEYKKVVADLVSEGYTQQEAEDIATMANTATDAATKVKTFSQLLDTLGEAAQSGWTQTWENIIGDYEQAKELWTGVSDELSSIINNSANSRNDVISEAMSSGWSKFSNALTDAGGSVDELKSKIREVLEESGSTANLDDLITKYGSIENVFKKGALSTDVLTEALGKLKTTASDLDSVTAGWGFGDTDDQIKTVQSALKELGYNLEQFGVDGKIGSETTAAIKAFQEAEGIDITGIVDEATLAKLKEASSDAFKLSDDLQKLAESADQLGGRDILIQAFANSWKTLRNIMTQIGAAWNFVFPSNAESKASKILSVINGFNSVTEKVLSVVRANAFEIRTAFIGIFSVVKSFGNIISSVFSAVVNTIASFLSLIHVDTSGLLPLITNLTTGFSEWLNSFKFAEKASAYVKSLKSAISEIADKGLTSFADKIAVIKDHLSALDGNIFGNITSKILNLGSAFKTWLTDIGIFDKLVAAVTKVKTAFADIRDNGLEGLSNTFTKLKSSINESLLSNFSISLGEIKKSLTDFGGGIFSSVIDGFSSFGSSITENLGKIPEFISGLNEKIKAFIEYIKSLGGITKDNIGEVGKNFKDNVLGYIGDKFESLGEVIVNFKNKVAAAVSSFGGIGNTISDFFKVIVKAIDSSDVGKKLLTGGLLAALTVFSIKLIGLASKISGIIGLFIDYAKDFTKVKLADAKADVWNKKAKNFRIMAEAILMIAASLALVARIKTTDLLVSAGVILVLIAVCALLPLLINKVDMSAPGSSIKSVSVLIKYAAVIFALALSLKMLAGIKIGEVMPAIVGLIGVIGSLYVLTKVMGKFGDVSGSKAGALQLLAFSGSILLLVIALAALNRMDMSVGQAIVSVGSLCALIVALGYASNLASAQTFSGGAGLLMIALSINVLVRALQAIIDLDLSPLKDKILNLIVVIGLLVGLMAATKLAGENGWSGGVGLLAMSAGILILCAAIKVLGNLDTGALKRGVAAVSVLMIVMGLVMALSYFAGNNAIKAGAMFLLMAAAITSMTLCCVLLSRLDPSGLSQAVVALTVLSGIIAMLILVLAIVDSAISIKTLASLTVLTLVIIALTACLSSLAGLDASGLQGAVTAIIVVIGVMTAMTVFVGCISLLGPNLAIGLVVLGTMILMITVVGVVLSKLADMKNVDNAIVIAEQLANLFRAFSGIFIGLGIFGLGVGVLSSGMASLIKIMAIVIAIGPLLAAINDLTGGGLSSALLFGIEFLKGLFVGIGELIGSLVNGFLSVFTPDVEGIGTGLATFVQNLQPFIEGVKNFDDSTLDNVGNLISMFNKITGASFLDRITSFGSEQTNMERFATNMSQFADAIIAYNNKFTDVTFNQSQMEMATNAGSSLVDMCKHIPRSGGIFNAFSGDVDFGSFSDNIGKFASGIAKFGRLTNTTTFDQGKISAATEAGVAIADMAKALPKEGGAFEIFTGKNSFSTFGTNLTSFGTGIASFATSVSGVTLDGTNMEGAISLIKAFAKLAESSVGVSKYQTTNISNLFSQLGPLMAEFQSSVAEVDLTNARTVVNSAVLMCRQLVTSLKDTTTGEDIDTSKITNALSVIDDLNDANAKLKDNGTGNFSDLSSSLGTFKTDLSTFVTDMASIDISEAQTKVEELKTFITEFQTAFMSDGTEGGGSVIDSITTAVSGLGTKISEAFSSVDTSTINTDPIMTSIGTSISENTDPITTAISGLGSTISEAFGSIDTSGLAASAESITTAFASGITNNAETIKSALYDAITSAVNQASSEAVANASTQNTGSQLVSQLASSMSSDTSVGSAGTSLANSGADAAGNQSQAYYSAGSRLASAMADGVINNPNVSNAAQTITVTAANASMDYYGSFYSAGSYIGSGLAAGIQSQLVAVQVAAAALAAAAAVAIAARALIHSPSRVTMRLGRFMGMGLTKGINAESDHVSEAAGNMTGSALDQISTTMAAIGDAISSDMDINPQIVPLVDTSEVAKSAGIISNMLSFDDNIGVMSDLRAINTSMNRRNQNGDESTAVVGELRRIRSSMSDLSTGTTNIVNGVTSTSGSEVSNAVETLIRAITMEARL